MSTIECETNLILTFQLLFHYYIHVRAGGNRNR